MSTVIEQVLNDGTVLRGPTTTSLTEIAARRWPCASTRARMCHRTSGAGRASRRLVAGQYGADELLDTVLEMVMEDLTS